MTPEEINKKAYEKYPVWMDTWYDCYGNSEEIDLNEKARNAYIEAYKEISALPTIKGWVARDKEGDLYVFRERPERTKDAWYGTAVLFICERNNPYFPSLRWEDEPIEVELPIIRK